MAVGLASAVGGSALILASNGDRSSPAGNPSSRPEVPATAMDQGVEPANNSPNLVADPSDGQFVVLANRLDGPDFSCALHVSGDGARSWAPVSPVPKLPSGAEKCYAPEVAFDRNGDLYFLFVGLAGPGNEPMGAFLTTSADRGRTFSTPRRVLGPLNFAVRMAINPQLGESGRLHLVWIKATSDPPLGGFGPPPNPILSSFSDDGGRTFSDPIQVNDRRRTRVVAPTLVLGPDRRVHVAYYDLEDDAVDYQGLEGAVWDRTWSIVLSTSDGSGQSFRESVAEASVVPPERVMLIFTMTPPALAVHNDHVCLAWADARLGDSDVFSRCSADRGRRWGGPRRVNDDKVGNSLSQLMPRLAFSPEGRLDAIFYDRRRHVQNVLNHVFFTFSDGSGQEWAPNSRLTRHASSSHVGPQYANASAEGKVEFGSRLGLLSRSGGAVAAWADTRNSSPDSAGQDVFTTIVRLPHTSSDQERASLAIGCMLMLIGAIALVAGARRPKPSSPIVVADDGRDEDRGSVVR